MLRIQQSCMLVGATHRWGIRIFLFFFNLISHPDNRLSIKNSNHNVDRWIFPHKSGHACQSWTKRANQVMLIDRIVLEIAIRCLYGNTQKSMHVARNLTDPSSKPLTIIFFSFFFFFYIFFLSFFFFLHLRNIFFSNSKKRYEKVIKIVWTDKKGQESVEKVMQ